MKKVLLCMAFLLTLFNIDGAAFVRYVTTNLNLRCGPGTEYDIITTLPKGTSVTIDEDCDCPWIVVEYRGYVGYISSRYLSNTAPRRVASSGRNTYRSQRSSYSSRTSGVRYYTNVEGYRVQAPTYYDSKPSGATALCRDGTYSFSRNRRGTCSHHGGVARWY